MPEPDYAGDNPSFWGCLASSMVIFVILLLLQSC